MNSQTKIKHTYHFDPFYGPEIQQVIKTTKAQYEILLDCKLGGDSAKKAFNIPCSLLLKGQLHVDFLKKAIQELISRHEALRSSFSENADYMTIFKTIDLPIVYHDVADFTDKEQHDFINKQENDNAEFLFDLINGPLFTVTLITTKPTEHVVLFNFFHGICDGLSVDAFLKDLSILYSSHFLETPPQLPVAKQFSDFAIAENLFLDSEKYKSSLNYWLNQFKDTPKQIELDLDFERPKIRTYNNDILYHKLDSAVFEQLKTFGITTQLSIATVFLSAFEIFLNQLTNATDLVVGLSISRQAEYNMIGMIGHTANVLPLRSSIDLNDSFIQHLNKRKSELFNAYEHQGISFGQLIQQLKIPRDISRIPLVPVMLNIELNNTSEHTLSFHGLEHTLLKTRRNYGTFEIEVQAHMLVDGPYLGVNYNTSLFTDNTIKDMMVNFETVLKQLVQTPDLSLHNVLASNATEAYILLNKTHGPISSHLLPTLFITQAETTPDNSALIYKNKTYTYRELLEKTNQIAHYLLKQQVLPGDYIAVSLPRCPELVPILLAIMQCGAAYVPLDPNFPKSRLDFMLEDSKAKLLITTQDLEASFPSNPHKLFADDLFNQVSTFPTNPLNLDLNQDCIAYVLYTSGSTGKPKGVSVTHKNLVNFLTSMAKAPGITERDRLLSITTISFDIAGLELFLPLLHGAILELPDDETTKDGRLLLELLEQNNITILQATPTTWQMLIDIGWETPLNLKALCGGEALTLNLARNLLDRCDELWNMYGPTETTIWSTIKQIDRNLDFITIGKPILNTQVYIVDKNGSLAKPGDIGEIAISGYGVALGYLNRPELTKEKFKSNSFSTTPNEKLYFTGDLGKLLPNGELQCLGRADQQVKIRGYRIELGEIEQALTLTSPIQSAAVTAQNNKLIAHIVLNQHITYNNSVINDIKNTLKNQVPDYFIPQEFKVLETLPVTLNGKIDRKALIAPQIESSPSIYSYTKPRTKAESIVYKIWQDCLNLETIDIFSDFFELGGQSVIAVKIMSLLEEKTGKRLPLASLFTHSSIEKLALLLDMDNRFITWDSLVPIKKEGSKTPLYIVHGAGMNVLIFNALAKNLDDDQPVYGLQAKGLNGIDKPYDTVEDMAAHYIDAILKVNPNGPYAIAGYSFGGIIAYEMARQMKALNKDITMLAMLDTYVHPQYYYRSAFRKKIARLNYRMRSNLHVIWEMLSSWEHTKLRLNIKKNNLINLYLRIKHGKAKQHEVLNQQPYLLDKMNGIAISNYHIKPGQFEVDLFRVEDSIYYVHDTTFLGWSKVALKGVKIHNIPGDHVELFSPPNDKKSALILQKTLDERAANFKK